MGNLWLKIKVWAKVILFSLVALYVLLFIYNNSGKEVDLWYWFNHSYKGSALLLAAIAFVIGVVGTLLVRTIIRTVRQIRDVNDRTRALRLEREMMDMKTKAAKLQTRTDSPPPPASPE
jgi:lysylphosphatidylglycerol synthetase-like protein (DUF2156 family)